jgi:hypothetical protein
MKKGFFRLTPLAYLMVFSLTSGCATLFDFGAEENPSEYDRGYTLDSDECTGRFCDTEADADSGISRKLASEMGEENNPNYRIKTAIETRDIILGMTRQDVSQSWGEPVQREVAGNGRDGHERWIYGSRYSLGGSRTVIFENGKVAGWHR